MTVMNLGVRERGVDLLWPRWLSIVMMLLLAAALVLLVVRFFSWAAGLAEAVTYPNQIDYGEGIIWQQADLILDGKGYKDISSLPQIVFHYPPVFHLASGFLARALGFDQLVGGRIVSALSSFGILFLIGLLVYRASPESVSVRLVCAGFAGLIAPNFYPFAVWSATDRVDMLAIFLSLLGAAFALRAVNQQRNAVLASLFFVLAIFTKQTMIAAPIAAFAVLLFVKPRAAWLGLGVTAVLGVAALFAMQVLTGGGFLQHIVGYNVNRLRLTNGMTILFHLAVHLFLFVLAYASAALIMFHLRNRRAITFGHATPRQSISVNHAQQVEFFAVCYLATTTLFLVTVLKSGANFNYLIEWMCACSIQIGLLLRIPVALALASINRSETRVLRSGNNAPIIAQVLALLIPIALLIQIGYAPAPYLPTAIAGNYATQQFSMLTDMIGRSSKPVISDNMVAIKKAGKELFLEPAIIAELTAIGTWDESRFLIQVRAREFGFIVTQDSRNDRLFNARYSPAVRSAIQQCYPRTEKLAGYTLHFPQP